MTFIQFFMALGSAMIINNVVFHFSWGVCPLLGTSNKIKSSIGLSLALIIVMVLSTILVYPIFHLILVPLEITFMRTIVFILIIAVLVQLIEIIIKRYSRILYDNLGIYLPLLTTNCAILGIIDMLTMVAILDPNIVQRLLESGGVSAYIEAIMPVFNHHFLVSIVISFGSGLGFMMVMVIFSGIREFLESANIPRSFKGAPIAFVIAGIMALAFLGLQGAFPSITEVMIK